MQILFNLWDTFNVTMLANNTVDMNKSKKENGRLLNMGKIKSVLRKMKSQHFLALAFLATATAKYAPTFCGFWEYGQPDVPEAIAQEMNQ